MANDLNEKKREKKDKQRLIFDSFEVIHHFGCVVQDKVIIHVKLELCKFLCKKSPKGPRTSTKLETRRLSRDGILHRDVG